VAFGTRGARDPSVDDSRRRESGARRALWRSLLGLCLLVAHAAPTSAQQGLRGFEGPFQVVADEVEYDAARDGYVARGHVRIEQKGRTLTADRVFFSNKTRIGLASGDVVVTEGGDTLRSDFLEFNVDDLTGVVFEGRLESNTSQFEMSGQEIRKTGDQTYVFQKGRFTTCRCPKPEDKDPWTLTADKADLEFEGYARARNATMEVLGVPVLWSPYVVFPLKRERQSGLLMPEIGYSGRNGFEAGLPYFWAARENVNVLLTPQYLTKRGFKPAAETEYVYGSRGAGSLYGTFIHDMDIDSNDPDTPFDQNRWGLQSDQMGDLPLSSWFAADGAAISDNEVPFDFDDFDRYRNDRFLNSRAFAATDFGPSDLMGFQTAFRVADDLQNPSDQDRDSVLLQRLPQVSWDSLPASLPFLPGLVASGGLEYVNFQAFGDPNDATRELRIGDFFYDTGADAIANDQERNAQGQSFRVSVCEDAMGMPVPCNGTGGRVTTCFDADGNLVPCDIHGDNGQSEINGVFNEGEPLADHGSRLVAHPRLSYPLRFADLIEVVPEVGWYGTFYDTSLVGVESRQLVTGRLDVRTQARGELDLPLLGVTRHLVEPHVSWVVLQGSSQDRNPLLVPPTAVPQERLRQLALDNLILDPSDRLEDLSTLVFGVGNRFLGPLGVLLGEFDVSSEYRMERQQWGLLVVQGETRLPQGWWLRFHAAHDIEEGELADGLADAGWSHPSGHAAGLRYRYLRQIPRFFEAFVNDSTRFGDFDSGFLRVNQIGAFGRVQITHEWAVTYAGSYSFENALSLVNQLGVEYLSRCRCWAIRVEAEEDRVRGFSWTINYRLLGLGDDRERPFSGATARRFDDYRGL
jgi:lipopolysaccharide assembly outer membrane protein LptD (OstA)